MLYPFGQAVLISTGTITDQTGAPTNPGTLALTVTLPDVSIYTAALVNFTADGTGRFHLVYLPPQAGAYSWRIVATSPNTAAEGAFTVAAAGMAYAQTGWQPAAADVAGLLAQRTVDATGLPTGLFSATTSPTDSQVNVLISDIAGEIAATCGPIPVSLYGDAKLVAILGAAAVVESSFDEGGAGSEALAIMYTTRYQLALVRLATACAQVNQSGQVEPEGSPASPLFAFPDISGDRYVDATTKYTSW
jgi:hypothetical protein